MINLRVENGHIRCDVYTNIFIDKKYFPLKFKITKLITNETIWEKDMYPGTWAAWNYIRDVNSYVTTNNGIILKELYYDYSTENMQIYEFWDYFCRINKNSVGLILGAGDGTWGEWVSAVNENKIECHLVEGSEKTFNRLKNTCGRFPNYKLYNSIITSDGRECEFYEGDFSDGYNTINHDYLQTMVFSPVVKTKKICSTSIYSLLETVGKIDWMRIDLEGTDYEIIKTIPKEILSSFVMLQYEHLGLLQEKRDDIDSIMIPMGFKKLQCEIDTIYFK